MTDGTADTSPQRYARMAGGVCYLLGSLASVLGQLVILELNAQAYDVGLVFFGFWCSLIGYLILRSTFLPRMIGMLEVLAGLGYLTLLWQPLVHYLYP